MLQTMPIAFLASVIFIAPFHAKALSEQEKQVIHDDLFYVLERNKEKTAEIKGEPITPEEHPNNKPRFESQESEITLKWEAILNPNNNSYVKSLFKQGEGSTLKLRNWLKESPEPLFFAIKFKNSDMAEFFAEKGHLGLIREAAYLDPPYPSLIAEVLKKAIRDNLYYLFEMEEKKELKTRKKKSKAEQQKENEWIDRIAVRLKNLVLQELKVPEILKTKQQQKKWINRITARLKYLVLQELKDLRIPEPEQRQEEWTYRIAAQLKYLVLQELDIPENPEEQKQQEEWIDRIAVRLIEESEERNNIITGEYIVTPKWESVFNVNNSSYIKQVFEEDPKLLAWIGKNAESLFFAIKFNNMEMVRFFDEKKIGNLLREETLFNPLQFAIIVQRLEIIKFFLDKPETDLRHRNIWGDNIFHAVFLGGDNKRDKSCASKIAILELLFHADYFHQISHLLNAPNHQNETPLDFALKDAKSSSGKELVKLLRKKGALFNPLQSAIITQRVEFIKSFLDHPETDLSHRNIWGDNIFHVVFLGSNNKRDKGYASKIAILELLFHADYFHRISHLLNAPNHRNETPLDFALRDGDSVASEKNVRLLKKRGALQFKDLPESTKKLHREARGNIFSGTGQKTDSLKITGTETNREIIQPSAPSPRRQEEGLRPAIQLFQQCRDSF